MRVWLAAGFTLVCFLTAGILYSFITDKSQDVLNERSTELAVGLAIAQQIMAQQGGGLIGGAAGVMGGAVGGAAAGAGGAAAGGADGMGAAGAGAMGAGAASAPTLPDLLTPADVAQALGVSEADVQAIIDSGDLKAKKIGSVYRVRRDALNDFLAS